MEMCGIDKISQQLIHHDIGHRCEDQNGEAKLSCEFSHQQFSDVNDSSTVKFVNSDLF